MLPVMPGAQTQLATARSAARAASGTQRGFMDMEVTRRIRHTSGTMCTLGGHLSWCDVDFLIDPCRRCAPEMTSLDRLGPYLGTPFGQLSRVVRCGAIRISMTKVSEARA